MMYNPINNVADDEKRLADRDQRDWNKKARYGIRYVADNATREEMLAEQDRLDKMSLNKVSRKRVTEEHGRGFDIIANDKLQGGLAKFDDATEYMRD